MGGVKDTAANLQAAVDGEGHEFREMYPEFLKEAEADGNTGAAASFRNALAVEEIHHGLYEAALGSVRDEKDLPERTVFVCKVCGNTVYDEAPDACSVCSSPRKMFLEVT